MKRIGTLAALAVCFLQFGCVTSFKYDLNNPLERNVAQTNIEDTSYLLFKTFLRTKERQDGISLANKLQNVASKALSVKGSETSLGDVAELLTGMDAKYKPDLERISTRLKNTIQYSLYGESIENHMYLIESLSQGILKASTDYIQYGFSSK